MNVKKVLSVVTKLIAVSLVVIATNYVCKVDNIMEVLDEKIIPVLVGISGAVMSVYTLLKPIFLKLDSSNRSLTSYIEKNQVIVEDNQKIREELTGLIRNLQVLESDVNTLIEMCKLGFSHDEKLVESGIANKICKKGEQNEIKKEEINNL